MSNVPSYKDHPYGAYVISKDDNPYYGKSEDELQELIQEKNEEISTAIGAMMGKSGDARKPFVEKVHQLRFEIHLAFSATIMTEQAEKEAEEAEEEIPTEDTLSEPGEEAPTDAVEDEELSDLEELEELIATLERQASNGFNLHLMNRIDKLKTFADGDNFDADGNRLDEKVPEREVVNHQISPVAATELEGWWEAPMGEFGYIPSSMKKLMRDAGGFGSEHSFRKETLGLSRARSNGAFVIRNQRETANYFLTHTEEAARKTGTTTRIIAMMGHQLDQWRYLFPTFDFYGASKKRVTEKEGVGHYALDPEVPFTEYEKDYFKWMGLLAQNSGFGAAAVGAGGWASALITNPKEVKQAPYVNGKKEVKGIPVATPNYHRIWWVVNHPWFALPNAVIKYNSSQFKYSLWRTMCFKANRIDYGYAAPIPGWVPREDIAPIDKSVNQARSGRHDPGRSSAYWAEANGENTAAWSQTKPRFCRGSELERDGTPKEY